MTMLRDRLRQLTRAPHALTVEGACARFELVRVLRVPPAELWPWLTEPARVACWSSAAVELRGPFAPGTERVVRLRLGAFALFTLRETLTCVEPGRMFAYRGRSVRDHQGSVRLDALHDPTGTAPAATRLTWTASFRAPAAPLARPMAAFVLRELGASLNRLTRLVGPPLTVSGPARSPAGTSARNDDDAGG